jgi:anti-sigma regulatory factor (Ser/Thr protein kinase)
MSATNGGHSDVGSAAALHLDMVAEVRLPADITAPGAARGVIARCLSGLAEPGIIADAQLLASELVTNSLQHAALHNGDPVGLRVYLGARAVRLEIDNPGTAGVIATTPPSDRDGLGGFGLALVDGVAAEWGVQRTGGTCVWCELSHA